MKMLDRFFGLKTVPPFDRLEDGELELVTEVATQRHYQQGELVCPRGRVMGKLLVTVQGALLRMDGTPLPPIYGLRALLEEQEEPVGVQGGPEGAEVVVISKGHFYTIIYECPELLVGFLQEKEAGV